MILRNARCNNKVTCKGSGNSKYHKLFVIVKLCIVTNCDVISTQHYCTEGLVLNYPYFNITFNTKLAGSYINTTPRPIISEKSY